jgi:hypothetical protein
MIHALIARRNRAENTRTTAKANIAFDLASPGRISAGAEVPGEHARALARITVWMVGAVLSALIPAITLHVSRGLLTSAEDLVLVSIQFVLISCFTVQAARDPSRVPCCAHQQSSRPLDWPPELLPCHQRRKVPPTCEARENYG